jgi:hypothetical protein
MSSNSAIYNDFSLFERLSTRDRVHIQESVGAHPVNVVSFLKSSNIFLIIYTSDFRPVLFRDLF